MRTLLCSGLVALACAGPTRIVVEEPAPPTPVGPSPQSSPDADARVASPAKRAPATSARVGSMTYLADGVLYRLDAAQGAKPENLGQKLDKVALGQDMNVAVSQNGAHMALVTTRFAPECAEWACLAHLTGDAEQPKHIVAGGQAIHPEGAVAISNDGTLIVYASGDGPHQHDLYAIEQTSEGGWEAPRLLTERSPHAYNAVPSLNPDASAVLFDCGAVPYSQEGTAICEVTVDGVVFNERIHPKNNPVGAPGAHCAHHGSFMPDGSILFEADWAGQQLWILPKGETVPLQVNKAFANDNRPCALEGGYVASLWYDRPGNTGTGELKIMQPDGPDYAVLTPSQNVSEVACHDSADAAQGDAEH